MKKLICILTIISAMATIVVEDAEIENNNGIEKGYELEEEIEASVEAIDEYIYAMEGMMC